MIKFISRYSFLLLLLLFISTGIINAEEVEPSIFYKILVSIISSNYSEKIELGDMAFDEILEGHNIWTAVVHIKEIGDATIVIDNLNLCVVLIEDKGPVLLYRGMKSPPPWSGRAVDKTWIYEYLLKH